MKRSTWRPHLAYTYMRLHGDHISIINTEGPYFHSKFATGLALLERERTLTPERCLLGYLST
jgi:hypothetical protein